MKFKFRKKVSVELRKIINVSEFNLTIDYQGINKSDLGVFESYMNLAIDKLKMNPNLLGDYKVNDYLRLQFDNAYCERYGLKVLEVEEVVQQMKNMNDRLLKNNENMPINDSLTLKQAIDKYLKDLRINNDIKEKTLKTYNTGFNALIEFFKEEKYIKEITQNDVENLNEYFSKKMKASSRKSLIDLYKRFFNFLVIKKDLLSNEFNTIVIKSVSSDREAFTSKEVLKLINLASVKIKKQKKDIDLNLNVNFAAYTGMRAEEIANLRLKDIDLKNKFIYVSLEDTSRKKHQRFIPIHTKLLNLIKEGMKGKKQDDFLVYNHFSLKSKMSNINQDVNQYFIKKHIKNPNVSFHSFRHSFRVQLQMKNPELENYIDILMAHTNKNSSIGFKTYGHNNTDWNKLVKLINEINYEDKFSNNFQQMFLDKVA